MSRRSPFDALRDDRTVQAVAALAALALLARLALLGQRVAHQDEARVGYWTVRYLVSGQYEYRPIVHGPFIPVVTRPVFAAIGPSDFAARLPIAVVGALAPAAALLFRTRLRDAEVVALAFLLSFNPVLLYYSRFMRQDVPLATFMLVALGLAVRAIDAERSGARRRYLYGAGLAFGLAFTTKENALLYPLCWAGALALLFDHRLFRARLRDSTPLAVARSYVPDPPEDAAVRVPPDARWVGTAAFFGANPAVLGVGFLGSEWLLAVGFLAAIGGYLLAVRGATVWHFVPALGMGWAVVALPTGILGAPQSAFWFALWWIPGVLLLFDERASEYGTEGRRGTATADAQEAVADGGRSPDRPDSDGAGGEEVPDDGRTGVAGSADDGVAPNGGTPPDDARDGAAAPGEDGWDPRWRSLPPLGVAYLLALAVVVFFYAPRGGGYPAPGGSAGVGLWGAITSLSPGALDAVFWDATYDTWQRVWSTWASGSHQDHAYLPYFRHFAESMSAGALVVTVGAAGGLVVDRYAPDGPRDLVAFAGYWGVASVFGYPLVTDIQAAWTTVHAVVPLAIPAAVGLALVYRTARGALADDDGVGVTVAVLILLLVGAQVGYAAGTAVYLTPQSPDNQLVQYAQSSSTDVKPVMRDVRVAAAENEDGVDVLFYGDEFDSTDESAHDLPPAGPGWFDRLPIAWYLEVSEYRLGGQGGDLVVNSTLQQSDVRRSDAPVVVALRETEGRSVPYSGDTIERDLDGYRAYYGHRYQHDSGTTSAIVVYVDTSLVPDPAGNYDAVVGNRSAGRIPG
ncbi:hypothetical protein BRD00_06830 [Halobacteriales archaeon QS_8_69_26]|nr:MAG: hypothetical protein BRD00_06830 [Halobacteriales archaeon QS_8_69_26]